MIAITPQMRILLAVEPVDFRKGIDGLVGCCRQALAADPFSGTLFVFSSRSRQSLKIICYDGYRTLAIMGRAATRWGRLLRKTDFYPR
jgi:transposase